MKLLIAGSHIKSRAVSKIIKSCGWKLNNVNINFILWLQIISCLNVVIPCLLWNQRVSEPHVQYVAYSDFPDWNITILKSHRVYTPLSYYSYKLIIRHDTHEHQYKILKMPLPHDAKLIWLSFRDFVRLVVYSIGWKPALAMRILTTFQYHVAGP